MLKPCYLAGFGASCLALAAFAAGPPVETEEAKAARPLIEALGDRDWAARDRAERRIVAMGLAGLPVVRRAATHHDPEVRRRAMRLLPALEHAALVMPKRYTFSVVGRPFAEVVESLKKATGYKIENNAGTISMPAGPDGVVPPGERKFTYHFKNATYWEIMDRITADVGLQSQNNYGDDIVRLYQGGTVPAHVGYDGAFRYAATSFQMYRNVDLSRPAGATAGRSESLTLSLTVSAEPHMPFLSAEQPRLEVARDDRKGSMLLAPTPDEMGGVGGVWGGRFISRRHYGGGYKQPTVQVSVNLSSPSVGASKLALVKGVVPVTLLIAQKPLVVTDDVQKAKGLKKDMEGVEFHIQDYKSMPNNQCQVQFTVNNKANPGDYNFLNTIYQRIELFDDKGVKYQNYGSSWGGGGGGVMNLTLTFGHFGGAKIGPPTKFVYHHWVTKTHEVGFEFKDLPLP